MERLEDRLQPSVSAAPLTEPVPLVPPPDWHAIAELLPLASVATVATDEETGAAHTCGAEPAASPPPAPAVSSDWQTLLLTEEAAAGDDTDVPVAVSEAPEPAAPAVIRMEALAATVTPGDVHEQAEPTPLILVDTGAAQNAIDVQASWSSESAPPLGAPPTQAPIPTPAEAAADPRASRPDAPLSTQRPQTRSDIVPLTASGTLEDGSTEEQSLTVRGLDALWTLAGQDPQPTGEEAADRWPRPPAEEAASPSPDSSSLPVGDARFGDTWALLAAPVTEQVSYTGPLLTPARLDCVFTHGEPGLTVDHVGGLAERLARPRSRGAESARSRQVQGRGPEDPASVGAGILDGDDAPAGPPVAAGPAGDSSAWPATLALFFSPVVLRALRAADPEAVLRPREADLTVLFCDLRGFSREAERHALMPFLERVSRALGFMTRSIIREEGVIGDFHGDAAMGFWGWPFAQPDRASRVCRTALGIHALFEAAGQQPGDAGCPFRAGIGIASGRAVAGTIGTADQVKVTAFGPVVNLASRLEGMTKLLHAPILLDEATAQAVRAQVPATVARVRRLAVVRPCGLDTPLTVSELLPPAGPGCPLTDADLVQYEAALAAFVQGDWTTAAALLGDLPGYDHARDFLTATIARHGGSAPPQWDGVVALASKS